MCKQVEIKKTTLLVWLLSVIFVASVFAGHAELLKDIGVGGLGSNPHQFAIAGERLYFASKGDPPGVLWATDGTEEGTVIVKDFRDEAGNGYIHRITAVGETIYLSAVRGEGDRQLWKSDGTAEGTVKVQTGDNGAVAWSPDNLTGVGDILFFTAKDGEHGEEPWVSDGTDEGTFMVANVKQDPGTGSSATGFADVGGRLFFIANGIRLGRELWVSDGTPEGTHYVEEVGPKDTLIVWQIVDYKGKAYFAGHDGYRWALWVSDGTTEGTGIVKTIFPNGPAEVHNLVVYNDLLYFFANDWDHGKELWSSDGTAEGTVLVKDMNPGQSGSIPYGLTVFDGLLYFSAIHPEAGVELWTSDGTAEGTAMVKDIADGSSWPKGLVASEDLLFFLGNDFTHGYELWATDGSADGTYMVKEIREGMQETRIEEMISFDGKLFFNAQDDSYAQNLWTSDGTERGTRVLKYTASGPDGSNPRDFTVAGDKLYFTATSPAHGRELWVTDGTKKSTFLTRNISQGRGSTDFGERTGLGGQLFFIAQGRDDTYMKLWKTDGTREGTQKVSEMRVNYNNYNMQIRDIIAAAWDLVYFAGWTNDKGIELWATDGTTEGTYLVKDISPEYESSEPHLLTAVGERLFFAANMGQLWVTDGTEEGTRMLYNPLDPWGEIRQIGVFNDRVFFCGDDGVHGGELWVSNGTVAGTQMVADIVEGLVGSGPYGFTPAGGLMYFSAFTHDSGGALWCTDGTAAGTYMVKDINPDGRGVFFGDPRGDGPFIAGAGDRVFFVGDDGEHGEELWVSDGTEEGTYMVRDIYPGTQDSMPTNLTVRDGLVFFVADSPDTGVELWVSDGTAERTVCVKDIIEGPTGAAQLRYLDSGMRIAVFDDAIYFAAEDGVHGFEPWRSRFSFSDISEDGRVNMIDLGRLGVRWLDTGCDEQNLFCDGADIDHKGQVGIEDAAEMASEWLR